ncbi:unnamed protein product [Ectocarpus sp. CCAP 1310/34]|nr:unnamed protein product [Ectocarpus sp. CCAP 1310/34]
MLNIDDVDDPIVIEDFHAILVKVWNRRGISLLSHAGTVLQKIVGKPLSDYYCEKHDILPEEQCAFRPGRSTVDTMFVVQRLQELSRRRNIPASSTSRRPMTQSTGHYYGRCWPERGSKEMIADIRHFHINYICKAICYDAFLEAVFFSRKRRPKNYNKKKMAPVLLRLFLKVGFLDDFHRRSACGSELIFEFPPSPTPQTAHSTKHNALLHPFHCTQPHPVKQTIDAMKLDGVQSLPLKFNSYAEAVISMLRDRSSGLTDAKLLKHLQNGCIVYACLAVKRNAGIVSTQARHAAAAQGYKDIAVPGFIKRLQENLDKEDFFLQPWLTCEVMGKSSMKGGAVLFTDGEKLWKRFDKILREQEILQPRVGQLFSSKDNLGTNYRRAAKTKTPSSTFWTESTTWNPERGTQRTRSSWKRGVAVRERVRKMTLGNRHRRRARTAGVESRKERRKQWSHRKAAVMTHRRGRGG